jgi:hypothetical protein
MQALSGSRLTAVEARNEADAVLRITVKSVGPGNAPTAANGSSRVAITAQLVNARGDLVWTTRRQARGGQPQGNVTEVAARLVNTLLRDVQRAGQ